MCLVSIPTMLMVLVSLMEDQESISGPLLLPFMKLILALNTTVPVLTLIKQAVPQILLYSWVMITFVILRYQYIFHGDDPLWDGTGCGPLNTCCTFNNPPWFYKELPEPTTDDIEMRVCNDQGSTNEDIARLIYMYNSRL